MVSENYVIHFESVIYFDSNVHTLSIDDENQILNLLAQTQNLENYKFQINAHTDKIGSDTYNDLLSRRRQKAVSDFLLSQNISQDIIESDFHGEKQRIALEESAESRKLNRRVVLQIITNKDYFNLSGKIIDKDTKKGLVGTVQLRGKNFERTITSGSDGHFKIFAPMDTEVLVKVEAENYLIERNKLKLSAKHKDNKLTIPLAKINDEDGFLYVEGKILDEISSKGISAEVILRSKDFQNKTTSDSSGSFKLLAPLNKNVSIEVTAKDHLISSQILKVSEKHKIQKIEIKLPKIELGKIIQLKRLLFIGNTSSLLPSSIYDIEQLKRFMIMNPEYCIEIAGHINLPNRGKISRESDYYYLSVDRALEVYKSLINIGIGEERMLARGYGNWNMVYPYAATLEEMKYNMRVEFVIMDCGSISNIENDTIPLGFEYPTDEP